MAKNLVSKVGNVLSTTWRWCISAPAWKIWSMLKCLCCEAGSCFTVTLTCEFASAVWSAPHWCVWILKMMEAFFFFKHNVQKVACVPKVTMSSLHPLLFNTRPDVWGFICFKLLYVCFYSVLMWISSAALESSHHRVELKQPRAMWLCELFLLSLWILHSPEWP